jgi:hypothetical protein
MTCWWDHNKMSTGTTSVRRRAKEAISKMKEDGEKQIEIRLVMHSNKL